MNWNKTNRRHFLRGLGGFTLALPFLPSLAPKAMAQVSVPPRLVLMWSPHGGLWNSNWFPLSDLSQLSKSHNIMSGHDIRYDDLINLTSDGKTLSPVIQNLTPALINKLTMINGLDITRYLSHHDGANLGNPRANSSNSQLVARPLPTLDQLCAYAPGFYPSNAQGILRTLNLTPKADTRSGMANSWGFSQPATQTGNVVSIKALTYKAGQEDAPEDPLQVFNAVFGVNSNPTPPTQASKDQTVVDSVLDDYRRLRKNRRISSEDKNVLDNHISLLHDLHQSLNATTVINCGTPSIPRMQSYKNPYYHSSRSISDSKKILGLFNDIIVAAFRCGKTRVATNLIRDFKINYQGAVENNITINGNQKLWHHRVGHGYNGNQSTNVDIHKYVYETAFLDLIKKMDAGPVEANGKTMLDNSLIMWTMENTYAHENMSNPCLLAGSASGFLKTGQIIDYSNRTQSANNQVDGTTDPNLSHRPGLYWNQMYDTILQAMGVPHSYYNSIAQSSSGYGDPMELFHGKYNQYKSHYTKVNSLIGSVLPLLKL